MSVLLRPCIFLLAVTGISAASAQEIAPVPARLVSLEFPQNPLPRLRAFHHRDPQVFINRISVPNFLLVPAQGIQLTKEQLLASLPLYDIQRVTQLNEDALSKRKYRKLTRFRGAWLIEMKAPQLVRALRHQRRYGPY